MTGGAARSSAAVHWRGVAEDGPRWAGDLAYSALVSGLFLAMLCIHGPVNLEQYHHSHASVRIFHRALLDGDWIFWTNALGLGTPLPLGENLSLHPLFLLERWLPLGWIMRVFWWVHLSVGGWYLMRLCRAQGADHAVTRVAVLGFVFSVASANYSYVDDWPSVFLGWTLLPLVIFYTGRITLGGHPALRRRSLVALALVLTFVLWNSHWGYWLAQGPALVAFALLASRDRLRAFLSLVASLSVAIVLAGDRLLFVFAELVRFPAPLEVVTLPPFAWQEWLRQLYWPASSDLLDLLRAPGWGPVWERLLETRPRMRVPFLGTLFAAGAVWTLLRSGRAGADTGERRMSRALAAAFAVSVVVSTLPPAALLHLPSGMWLARDTALVFGLVAAAPALSSWRRQRSRRGWVHAALALQVVQLCLVALPAMLDVEREKGVNVSFYDAPRREDFASWVKGATSGRTVRVVTSPGVTRQLLRERAVFREIGLLGTGDLVKYGLHPLNGYFKNVSMDSIYPSFKRLGGWIRSEPEHFGDPTTFDVLGIELLLAFDGEPGLERAGFERVGAALPTSAGRPLRLLRNPDALPLAGLYRSEAADLRLRARPGCPFEGLLCDDLHPLEDRRLPDVVRVKVRNDRIDLAVEPAAVPRIAVLAVLYRSAWQACTADGERLRTFAVSDALLAVEVPTGASAVEFSYEPFHRRALVALGLVGWLALAGTFVWLPRRARG